VRCPNCSLGCLTRASGWGVMLAHCLHCAVPSRAHQDSAQHIERYYLGLVGLVSLTAPLAVIVGGSSSGDDDDPSFCDATK